MTVLGLGLDVVDVAGFSAQLDDSASVFVEQTFTPAERAYASAKTPKARAWSLAGRFAAKEAFIKAWSASRRGQLPALERVDLREIEVVVDPHGRPSLMLHGVVEDAFTRGAPCAIHLSISHDGPVAAATVLIDQPA